MSNENSDDNQFYTEAVGTRLSPQTKRQFDQYKTNNELSNSEALRRLVRAGIEKETEAGYSLRDQTTTATAIAFFTGWPTLAATTGNTNTAISFVVFLTLIAFFEPQITTVLKHIRQKIP